MFKLAKRSGKYFLARPRRFGKSLLISTSESLFKYGLRDFKGLKIEKVWQDNNNYQVVRLDFSEIKNFSSIEEFKTLLTSLLLANFSLIGFRFSENKSVLFQAQLSSWLKGLPLSSLVLLIDEYDAPLTSCLNNLELFTQVCQQLSNFYAVLKSNDSILRFLFIAGITRFNKTSIFSDLNNLSDISLEEEFGTLLGYTHEEVETYFGDYLTYSSEIIGISKDELLQKLTIQYDGFCFERTAKQKVFVPWSLLKFFEFPKSGLIDDWFESGGRTSVLIQYLQSHSLKNPEEYAKQKSIALSTLTSSSDIKSLSDVGILTQAGYLTIKHIDGTTVYLDYPNAEVKTAMAQLYTEQLLSGKTL